VKVKPLIVSHRGDRTRGIENTIQASELAIEKGANALEIDVRQCASGEIVVFHDFVLKRMFGQNGYVGTTPLDKLRTFPYLDETGQNNSNTYIDTLDEFLDHFGGKYPINLDAKTIHFFDFKFADLLIDTVKNHGLMDSVWISCFNPFLLQILKLKNPDIRTGYLFQRLTWAHTSYDLITGTDAWHPHYSVVTPRLVEKARHHKKELHVWTVNTAEHLAQMKGLPVDGLISDYPDTIKGLIAE
jgi:glycerophosphoryl diester phosphodiesterase